MQLSKRLETILAMAGRGTAAADIGTDHGYVPIELVRRGLYDKAFAMDVRKGPLERASDHIQRAGLGNRVQIRLSDGLEQLAPGEAGTIIIAGMGGPLMERLLREGRETACSAEKMILSPQSEIGDFHRFLLTEGYRIDEECWIEDEGKYYVILRTVRADSDVSGCWSEAELEYGKIPLDSQSSVLRKLLERRIETGTIVLNHLQDISGESAAARRTEMESVVRTAREALNFYN